MYQHNMLTPSDRSRFASYLAVITSYEVIIAGVLNCKVAASRFVNVSAEVVNVLEEVTIEFDGKLFKREKLTMIRIITTIIAIIALFTEFTTEFESFCANILQ